MSSPDQEAIDTFISITGASDAVARRKLQEHNGDLNAAINSHFSEEDRNVVHTPSIASHQDDQMDIDDPMEVAPTRNPLAPSLEATMANPFSLPYPHYHQSLSDSSSHFTSHAPFVSVPREVREIPTEVKDNGDEPSRPAHALTIEDVTETEVEHGSETRGTDIVADEDDDAAGESIRNQHRGVVSVDSSPESPSRLPAPNFDDLPDSSNDIEEEMIRAAIEASKRDAQELSDPGRPQQHSHIEDTELAHTVSLSSKTATEEKTLHDQKANVGGSGVKSSEGAEVELGTKVASNVRLGTGSSSFQDEPSDAEDQPLVRHRSRRTSYGSLESEKDVDIVGGSPPLSTGQNQMGNHSQHNGDALHSDEWGGISSEEHDEAVMLEAAMFGGVPEGTVYRLPYAPHQFMHPDGHRRRMPRPPSPSLQAQRIIREQQDDEYLASLAADREKEMKAMEEAEARRLQEAAAKKAALEEEKRKEEELRRKFEAEQELERQLAAKEASLPQEPAADDENAITLLVRMPDGSRHGRRFLKSNSLQSLFDFIDAGRVVKPGTYRLVRPYPRRAFTAGDSALTLNELGLTSKQEALFLELM